MIWIEAPVEHRCAARGIHGKLRKRCVQYLRAPSNELKQLGAVFYRYPADR